MTQYQNNIITTLFQGPQGRAAPTTTYIPSAMQLDSGLVSPVDIVNNRLKSLITSLMPIIEKLASTSNTIMNIGDLIGQGQIPTGCVPTCRLHIVNPPNQLVQDWKDCLFECGRQLTAIIINHHTQRHQKILQNLNNTISTEFNTILKDYNTKVPELSSKLQHSHTEITQIIKNKEEQRTKKGRNNTNTEQFNDKRAKPSNEEDTKNIIA